MDKMEIKQEKGKEDREATKEKGTRFATHAEVPVQRLEAYTGSLIAARDDRVNEFHPRNLDEDLEDMTPRIPRDQDQEYGVQPETTGPQPKEDEDEDEDDEDEDDEGQEKCDAHIAAERTLKKNKKAVRGLDRQGDKIKRGGTADAIAEATVAEDAVEVVTMAKDAVGETVDADVVATTVDAVAAGTTAATVKTTANSAINIARNAAASRTNNTSMCSVVVLTSGAQKVGAGDMLSMPDADGEGPERAEALCPRSPAGNAEYAASACRQMVDAEPYRGGLTCALQLGVGTGSAHSTFTSAPKSDTHLPAMNGTPLTTGPDSVVTTASTDGDGCDGAAADAAAGVTVTRLDSQKGDTQPSEADSLATCTVTDLNDGGGVDVNGGVGMSGDAAVTDLDNPQQYHGEKSCVTASGAVVSRFATLNGAVGIVACATGNSTLSDGTPAAVIVVNVRLVAVAAAMAAARSTGPIEVEKDGPNDLLSECCMSAALNVPMETDDLDVAVLGEEVAHQLRRAETPGGFSDLKEAHDAAAVGSIEVDAVGDDAAIKAAVEDDDEAVAVGAAEEAAAIGAIDDEAVAVGAAEEAATIGAIEVDAVGDDAAAKAAAIKTAVEDDDEAVAVGAAEEAATIGSIDDEAVAVGAAEEAAAIGAIDDLDVAVGDDAADTAAESECE